jgi:hypothetical protein
MRYTLFLIYLLFSISSYSQQYGLKTELGERVDFSQNPNSKGLEISFVTPKNWEYDSNSYTIENQDKNLVTTIVDRPNSCLIQLYITASPNGSLMSKEKVNALFQDKDFIRNWSGKFKNVKGIDVVYINDYPMLRMIFDSGEGTSEGIQRQINFSTFYKDKFINFVGASLIQDFDTVLPFYKIIAETLEFD